MWWCWRLRQELIELQNISSKEWDRKGLDVGIVINLNLWRWNKVESNKDKDKWDCDIEDKDRERIKLCGWWKIRGDNVADVKF